MLEFILERYNYWIVITLMMTGLYIVYARGNLVKKIVGLNVFQTSIFIFYITIGKIAGGTAPIYIGDDLKKMKEGAHGDGHGDDHGEGHDAEGLHDTPEGAHANDLSDAGEESLHSKIENQFPDVDGNDLKTALQNLEPSEGEGTEVEGLHETVEGGGKIANQMFEGADKEAAGFDVAGAKEAVEGGLHAAPDAAAAAAQTMGAAASHGEIIYTNPLPHVLILTAIVVGVAGTAVGLALAVRIREAYGTIEEDELEAMDNVAEFGAAGTERAQ